MWLFLVFAIPYFTQEDRELMSQKEITQLLYDWQKGDQQAFEELVPIVYEELRSLSRRFLARERKGHTFASSDLVNEAYLRLAKQDRADWKNRSHFFGVAATMMRRILITHARERNAEKRGGDMVRVTLSLNEGDPTEFDVERLIALDQALEKLQSQDERKAKVVELKYFGGLTEDEIAEIMGISASTVRSDWRMARAWLFSRLNTKDKKDS